MQVPGDSVDWARLEFYPPMANWEQQQGSRWDGHARHATTLLARCWDFCADVGPGGGAARVTYDAPGMTGSRTFRCVVVGRTKAADPAGVDVRERLHYVVIVTPVMVSSRGGRGPGDTGASRDLKRYHRVGAGALPGRCIVNVKSEGEEIAIV